MKYIITILMSLLFTISAYAAPHSMQIDVFAKPFVNFKIVAPNGLATGYDPNIQPNNLAPNLNEIQGAGYGLLDMPDTPDIIGTEFNYIKNILAGNYKIVCFGRGLVSYTIVIAYDWQPITTPPISQVKKIGFANTGTVQTYEIIVPDSPASGIVINKIASPADLITDITTAGQLNYIGNARFVTEITKEINEIEAEKANGKMDDGLTPAQKAKKEYTELLKEITEKYNKPESDEFIKQEAYTVLKEDIEYIISHL